MFILLQQIHLEKSKRTTLRRGLVSLLVSARFVKYFSKINLKKQKKRQAWPAAHMFCHYLPSSSRAAKAGRVFPSINSIKDPPPVEMKLILSVTPAI